MTRASANNALQVLDGMLTGGVGDGAQVFTATFTRAAGETSKMVIDSKVYTAAQGASDAAAATLMEVVLSAAAEVTGAFTIVDDLAGVLTITSSVRGKKHTITGTGSAASDVVMTDDGDLSVDGSSTAVIAKLQPTASNAFMVTGLKIFLEDADIETGEFGTAAALVHGIHLAVVTGATELPLRDLGTIKKNADLSRMGFYSERTTGTAVESVFAHLDLTRQPIFLFGDDQDGLVARIEESAAILTDFRIEAEGFTAPIGNAFATLMEQYKLWYGRR